MAIPLLVPSALVTMTLFAGCTVGPNPRRPGASVDVKQPYVAAPASAALPDDEHIGWWQRFGDETTRLLVQQAMAENLDLRAAAARVEEARALVRQARGDRLPTIGANASASRRQQALSLPGAFAGAEPGGESIRTTFRTESYDVGLDVSWQIDLWGRLRRAQEATQLDLGATAADRQALMHTVIAETVRLRVAIATLQERLGLARQNLDSLRDTLEVTESRYRAGVGDPVALRLARENVAAAEAQVPPLEAQLALQEHALSVLVGRRPGAVTQLPVTLPPLPPLQPPPPQLPAALLDQRPDLQASQFRAMAAQARIGVAIADLLPNLALGAGGGYSSNEMGDLFNRDTVVWNLLASVAQPLFEGGRRRAAVAAARARSEAAATEYAATLLTAIQEVEDALVQERQARLEVEASVRSLSEARAAEELARDRYGQGLSPLLDVLEAERRRRTAEERLALARQQVWNARIGLHLALGGDWEARTPPKKGIGPADVDPAPLQQ